MKSIPRFSLPDYFMKKVKCFFIRLVLLLPLACILLFPYDALAANKTILKDGGQFYIKGLTPQNTKIISIKSADINNDGIEENVILTGQVDKEEKWNKESVHKHLKLFIQNPHNGKIISKTYFGSHIYCYNDSLSLNDFNGDKVPDIFIRFDFGESDEIGGSNESGFCEIYSFKNNKLLCIFNSLFFKKYPSLNFDFKYYKHNNSININLLEVSKEYNIDISASRFINLYDSQEVGKFYKQLYWKPVDLDKDGIYELNRSFVLCGKCYADQIATIHTVYKLNFLTGKWDLYDGEIISDYPYQPAKNN